jgi:4-amino-4-deoxy-L-arabinose transferase-like glycosyltransferase
MNSPLRLSDHNLIKRLRSLDTLLWLLPIAVLAYTLQRIQWSFNLDETRSAWNTASTLPEMFRRVASYEGKGPLYFLVLWSVRQIFGASEVVLRIPGVIFVVLTCLCLSRLGELLPWNGVSPAGIPENSCQVV